MSKRERIAARLVAVTMLPSTTEPNSAEKDRFNQDPYHINESLVNVEGSDLNHGVPDQSLGQVMSQNWQSG